MNTARLTRRGDAFLQEQLVRGPYRSAEEAIEPGLETLARKESISFHLGPSMDSPAGAVADILELCKGVRHDVLKIKVVIHEGHK
jgi:hypothetical protein